MADLVPSSVLEGSIDLIRQADRDPTEFVLAAGLPLDALHSPHTLINSISYAGMPEHIELVRAIVLRVFYGLQK